MYLTRITDDIIKNDMSNFYIIVNSFTSDTWEKFRIMMDLNGITDDILKKEMSDTKFPYEAYNFFKFYIYDYNSNPNKPTLNRDYLDNLSNIILLSYKEGLLSKRSLNDLRQYLLLLKTSIENRIQMLSSPDIDYFNNCIEKLKECYIKKDK